MPRALLTRTLAAPSGQRDVVLEHLRGRRRVARDAQCNYWIFEDASESGVLLEFVEARDEVTLRNAHSALDGAPSTQIFLEVEL